MTRLGCFLQVFLFLFLFLCPISTLWACQPSPGDAWFNKKVEFVKEAMPKDVELIEDYFGIGQGLTNKSREPFYLVRPRLDGESASHSSSEAPIGLLPLYKLVDGQVYFWSHKGEWKKNSGGPHDYADFMISMRDIMDTGVFERMFSAGNISTGSCYSSFFKDICGDNRVPNVTIPFDEEVALMGYSGGQTMPLKVRISYTWNEDYDPQLAQKQDAACQEALNNRDK